MGKDDGSVEDSSEGTWLMADDGFWLASTTGECVGCCDGSWLGSIDGSSLHTNVGVDEGFAERELVWGAVVGESV